MNAVTVKGITLGEGAPKICVPMVGKTREELVKEANHLVTIDCDIVEWRVDFFEAVEDTEKVLEMGKTLREILSEKPILFTFRTKKEGGELVMEDEKYFTLYAAVIPSGLIDLVDVELFMEEDKVQQTIALARENTVKVVMCNHDFDQTPEQAEIVNRLRMMQDKGADICKIAVMPNSSKDVLTLLAATDEMYTQYADRPIITMSMSGKGMVSRVSGEIFGSAMTFGAAAKASAPGQVPVGELREVLNLLHRSL